MLYGKTAANHLSQFVKEIPEELCEKHGEQNTPMSSYTKPERFSFLKEEAAKRKAVAAAPKNEVYGNFEAGDRVKHNIFGEGTVTASLKMGNDEMLTINFDTRGEKKVMRNNAKLIKM